MSDTLVSRILTNNTYHTEDYLDNCLLFVKSIILKNHNEAVLYNEHLRLTHPGYEPPSNQRLWRYYLHLNGQLHPLDTPMQITSVDNGQTISLNRDSLLIHRQTRQELLRFSQYYDEVVARYPYQQLYLKAILTEPLVGGIEDIIALQDYTIVGYNAALIDPNEHDLIAELQERLTRYKSIWLIPYYQHLDNLFLATQYHVLYQFLFTSLMAIRLANAKTMRAHSYHIRLYLASHFGIDAQMPFLSRRQQLYLYRNLLYFTNHAGREHTFRTLINELFNEHNVAVVNYTYEQEHTVGEDAFTDYHYQQKLLNSKTLTHSQAPYALEHLRAKEAPLAPSNDIEHAWRVTELHRKAQYSRFAHVLTKDLETVLIDETDSVKNKLLQVLVDYWAYGLHTQRLRFNVECTDPVLNRSHRLSARDLFKLYLLCLYGSHGVSLQEFPAYHIRHVFQESPPEYEALAKAFFEPRYAYRAQLQEILDAIPRYRVLNTTHEYGEFAQRCYLTHMGIWMEVSNYSDLHTHAQMEASTRSLCQSLWYTPAEESVVAFLNRTGIDDPREYDAQTLRDYVFNILDGVFDKKLSYLKRLRHLQDALTRVFSHFNSYTVQLINNYYEDSPILAGIADRRYLDTYSVKEEGHIDIVSQTVTSAGSVSGIGGASETRVQTLQELLHDNEIRVQVREVSHPELNPCVDLHVEVINNFQELIPVVTELVSDAHGTVTYQDAVRADFDHVFTDTRMRQWSMSEVSSVSNFDAQLKIRATPVQESGSVRWWSTPATPVESSDPVLMFLAMNS